MSDVTSGAFGGVSEQASVKAIAQAAKAIEMVLVVFIVLLFRVGPKCLLESALKSRRA
jgi:hypothetical protein